MFNSLLFFNSKNKKIPLFFYKKNFFFFKFFKFLKYKNVFFNSLFLFKLKILKKFNKKLLHPHRSKKYKPYNYFKFSILKYQRIVTTSFFFNINNYLLNAKFNSFMSMMRIKYLLNPNTVYFNIPKFFKIKNLLNVYKGINRFYSRYKKLLTFNKVKHRLRRLNRKFWLMDSLKITHKRLKMGKIRQYRFNKWLKRFKRTNKRNIKKSYRGKKYATLWRWKNDKMSFKVKKNLKYRFLNKNKLIINKKKSALFINNLTGFTNLNLTQYKQHKQYNMQQLKLFFNTYNYKTYNWRILI